MKKTLQLVLLVTVSVGACFLWQHSTNRGAQAPVAVTPPVVVPASHVKASAGTLTPRSSAPVSSNSVIPRERDLKVNPYAAGLREPGKSKREWDAAFIEQFEQAQSGDPVQFELTAGVMAQGVVKITQLEAGKISYVSGELTTPETGRFFFLTPPVGGKAGKAVGVVEFPSSRTAYRIEPTGVDGAPELWQRRLDEVICMDMPKVDPLSAQTATNETANIPPVRPDLVPGYIPSYNSNVVSLQSYPGSPAVLFLDFFGGYTPTWGGISYVKPANIDNVTIKDLWKRVAEDFMPFNINVTTDVRVYQSAQPGSRQRCCFTDTPVTPAGVAYFGSWNWGGDTPCWSVYTIGKNAAEVAAHEPGHTLGLGHETQEIPNGTNTTHVEYYGGQGSGGTGWAPIMGVGYYQPVATWCKGEFQYASLVQDELQTITTANNNVTYRNDDTGSTLATSRYLEVYANNAAFAEGVIELVNDTDAFQFTTTGGVINLTVNPVGDWADLAVTATLADATDTIIASNSPQTVLSATINTTLTAGTYTFRVTGAGRNDPILTGFSSYCSHGYYSVTGTVANARQSTRLSVLEFTANDTVVGSVPASGSSLIYEIASGNTGGTFAVDNTGVVRVANNTLLDYSRLATNTMYAVQFEVFMNIINVDNPALTELNRRVVIAVQQRYPLTPTSLTATALTSLRVSLSWLGGPGASSYCVKRSVTSGGNYTIVGSSSSTSYTDSGLTNGVSYYYVVSSINTNGESANSSEVSATPQAIAGFGFESPSIGSGNYSYSPTGGFWTFNGSSGSGSGLVANGSGFSNPNAPEGTQSAFVQGYGTLTQTLSGFLPGTNYTITYYAAQRSGSSQHGGESWNVTIDNNSIKANPPGSTSYTTYTASFTATSSMHTLAFVGTDLIGGDNTVFIDNVSISPALRPVAASVALTIPAANAVFVAPGTVTLTASVTTNGNVINGVQFYSDAGLISLVANAPYACSLVNLSAGAHSVFARVIFNDTSSADSALVNIAVININTNFGFELPSLGSGNHAYSPAGAIWTFNGYSGDGAGIVANGSAFGNPNAPEGTQAAFLQTYGTISQTLSGFGPGTNYTITYSAAQRPGGDQHGGESWNVTVDNNVIKTNAPGGTAYTTYTASFTATSTSHTLAFVGTDLAGGDNTVFLDYVRISPPISPGVLKFMPLLTQDTTPRTALTVVGDSITFTAAFSNAPAAYYQWQFITNGVTTDIPGATNSALTLTNLQVTNTGSYRLEAINATNSQGVAFSTTSPLTVSNVPAAVTNVITSFAAQTGLGNSSKFTPSWVIPSSQNLIAGKSPSGSLGNFSLEISGRTVSSLTDGGNSSLAIVSGSSGNTTSPNYVTCGNSGGPGSSLTYTLATTGGGYNLTNIIVYGGWADNGRDQQAYTIYYSTMSAPTTFLLLSSVSFNPTVAGGLQSATRATLSPANGVLASNVAAVKFDFTTPTSENGYCGYSEIVLSGTPSSQPVKWAVGNGGWDTTTLNWKLPAGISATNYFENSLVIFDDSATGTDPITVTLAGNRFPSVITNNSTKNYILSGNYSVLGGSLVKNGTSTLIIDNTGLNTFSNVTVLSGTVQVGNNDAKGSLGTGSVTNNGALAFNRIDTLILTNTISGSGALVQNGSGALVLKAVNTYTGNTTVSAGTLSLVEPGSLSASALIAIANGAKLDVSGRADQTLTLANGHSLKGSGTLKGSLNALVGSSLTPGDAIGTLIVQNNLTLNGILRMELNRTNSQSCDQLISTAGTITGGGTLTVTNLGTDLQVGDSFPLFSAPVSGFATIILPGLGLNQTWANKLAVDGTIQVISTVSTAPANLLAGLTATTMTLTWPSDHTGWRLQAQTNDAGVGLTTNWVEIPAAAATNQVILPVSIGTGSVFYRLVYP